MPRLSTAIFLAPFLFAQKREGLSASAFLTKSRSVHHGNLESRPIFTEPQAPMPRTVEKKSHTLTWEEVISEARDMSRKKHLET